MTVKKIVLVTGASRGIGAATALLFAKHSYDVVVNYKSNKKAALDVVAQIKQLGSHAVAIPANVSDEAEVSSLFNQIDEYFGRLDVLINNVGILNTQQRFVDMPLHRLSNVLQTNILSHMLCSQHAIKRMGHSFGGQGGCIVNVSSVASRTGSPFEYIDYAASKGAIDTFTKGLAVECAEDGIRVNAVRPGIIATDIHADGGEPDRPERLAKQLPLKRAGLAEEVAEAIFWLASEHSSFTTGSMLDVSGGL
ncbi:SDR family oxidoreductase [Thalassotalea euphylliae]|uniref:SDR family oxidoreductase n=1 Tax=Thalassotalea euphylliae TaxID=1655234 RepID=UPI0036333122